jgi:hypothetical protein
LGKEEKGRKERKGKGKRVLRAVTLLGMMSLLEL